MAIKLVSSCIMMIFLVMTSRMAVLTVEGAYWCVARSDLSDQALQTALDYACSAGADCTPLQSSGLCFLPNTIQAHASYAFNSFFQRRAMATGSCDFSGSATIAQSDPSYGSCVYPSSLSTAGGTNPPSTTSTNNNNNNPTSPGVTTITPAYGGSVGTRGVTPGLTPLFPDNSEASSRFTVSRILILLAVIVLLPFSFTF